jgi:hypothetical protein
LPVPGFFSQLPRRRRVGENEVEAHSSDPLEINQRPLRQRHDRREIVAISSGVRGFT